MKLQNMIRMHMVMAGVAAGLFLASAAPAQEITNQEWPDRPGATEALPAVTPQATAATATAVPASQPAMTQEAAVAGQANSGESVGFLLFGVVAVVLYLQTGTVRNGRKVNTGSNIERSVSVS